MPVKVTKADGSIENFKVGKLRNSLQKAGANKQEIEEIIGKVSGSLYDGIHTQEIYKHAFKLLRETEIPTAARYSLRRALFNLGPTGFPFEDFLARLFAVEGYQTLTRTILRGKCAVHEIDVAAYNEKHSFVAEAKFHARPGIKSDLQVTLYSYARLLDLKNQKICNKDSCGIKQFLLVTNTKFTTTAEQYARCVGLDLLSWDHPYENNLQNRVQKAHLYPITVLQTLSVAQKQVLLKKNIIICSDIVKNPRILRNLHLGTRKLEAVLSEARQLCSHR